MLTSIWGKITREMPTSVGGRPLEKTNRTNATSFEKTKQMMYSNDEITEEISEKVVETFDKRIDQDILALLNGWRR